MHTLLKRVFVNHSGFSEFLKTSIISHIHNFHDAFPTEQKKETQVIVADVDPLAPIEKCEGLTRAYNDEHRLHVHVILYISLEPLLLMDKLDISVCKTHGAIWKYRFG
jgi:hypothetical protein